MNLLTKELRRTGWMALLVLGWGLLIGSLALLVLASVKEPECPNVLGALRVSGCVLAVWLGARLTWSETSAGTWTLLLARPITRRRLVWSKLAIGLAVLWLATALPLALVSWAGSAPGLVCWPWEPVLLDPPWQDWCLLTPWYLIAFLAGLPHRAGPRARWLPLGAMALAGRWLVDRPLPDTAAWVAALSLLLLAAIAGSLQSTDWA